MRKGAGARAATPRLPDPPVAYNQMDEAIFRRAVTNALEDLAHANTIKPAIQVEAVRSGSSADLTVTILDMDRRVTAIEFNKREGSASATGWVSTWDTSTGTIGTDAELIRVEAVSIPAGLDSAAEWRVKWRDQQGQEHTESGPVPLANLASVTKTLRVPFTSLVPLTAATSWQYLTAYLRGETLGEEAFRGTAILPKGVTLTKFSVRLYRQGVADNAEVDLERLNDDNTSTTLVSALAHTSTGWQTKESVLSDLVADTAYVWTVRLDPDSNVDHTRVSFTEFEYTTPTYASTI